MYLILVKVGRGEPFTAKLDNLESVKEFLGSEGVLDGYPADKIDWEKLNQWVDDFDEATASNATYEFAANAKLPTVFIHLVFTPPIIQKVFFVYDNEPILEDFVIETDSSPSEESELPILGIFSAKEKAETYQAEYLKVRGRQVAVKSMYLDDLESQRCIPYWVYKLGETGAKGTVKTKVELIDPRDAIDRMDTEPIESIDREEIGTTYLGISYKSSDEAKKLAFACRKKAGGV